MGDDWRETVEKVIGLQANAMDTKPAPSVQWFPTQWLADPVVALVSWAARGFHFHLLMTAWRGVNVGVTARGMRRWKTKRRLS